jgi:hypothetical protein
MKVALVGSPTLKRFTEGILHKGLELNGCKVVYDLGDADFGIIQIHGAPAAREADFEIVKNLPAASKLTGSIVLLHRPDEIKDSIPHLRSAIAGLPTCVGLAMLGDLLIDDPFYDYPQRERRVIPHGFFNIDSDILPDPVIVGTHTTWGEMRSIENALLLLNAIAEAKPRQRIIGYLGGAPKEFLSHNYVDAILKRLHLSDVFTLSELDPKNWREQFSGAASNTIFIYAGNALPRFDVTFNVQLYHYGQAVRLGESSGSIHASAGIPIIFEMNGSERIEQLEVIKVPYSDPDRTDSANFKSAALQIVGLINSGEYLRMLSHNRQMTGKWSNQKVAQFYIDFFEVLTKKGITKESSRAQSAATS